VHVAAPGAPGLGGSLLVQHCIKGVQLAFTWCPGSLSNPFYDVSSNRLRSCSMMPADDCIVPPSAAVLHATMGNTAFPTFF
jgi:hypothetical protein